MSLPERQLRERRALITGAGSGLGRALALQAAAAGWRVACSDLRLDAAQETVTQIVARGGTATALAHNVTDDGDWRRVVDQVRTLWGGIDLLINNAGVATAGTVADSPLEQWRWVLDINLLGCVRGAQAVTPLMREQQGGHIVNIASFAGIANPPAMASYNVSKAAVISLSETLRFELSTHGVGVSVACPSFFKTALMETSAAHAPGPTHNSAPQVQKIVDRLMQKATVTADDVAADVLDAVERNRFLVITHPDAKQRYHLKRVAPEFYFRMARKATAKFLAP